MPPSGIASSRPTASNAPSPSASFSLNDNNLDDYPLPGQPAAAAASSTTSASAASPSSHANNNGGKSSGGSKKNRGTPTKGSRSSAQHAGGGAEASTTTSKPRTASFEADVAAAIAAAGGDPSKQGKGKDLSHVPCRFFKVGACTAGEACPFSHAMPESGQQKQICQWFIKGNCRFGHKCALAHVLPGETYAMDRKNKKAAQASQHQPQQQQSPSSSGQQQGQQSDGAGDHSRSPTGMMQQLSEMHSGSSSQQPMLGEDGNGAINGGGQSGQAPDYSRPMSFSPPEPGLAAMMANLGRRPIPTSGSPSAQGITIGGGSSPFHLSAVPETLRPSSFDTQQQMAGKLPPIGTPPASGHSPASWIDSSSRVPIATSSSVNVPASSRPFSSSVVGGEFAAMGRDIWGQRTSSSPRIVAARALSPSHLRPGLDARHTSDVFLMSDAEEDDDDDHGEEFLPSSLNELLTPRERARRLSRRESNQSAGAARAGWFSAELGGAAAAGSSWDPKPDVDSLLNRQAMSANATSGMSRVPWGESSEATIRPSSDRVRVAGFAVSPPSAPASGLTSLFSGGHNKSELGMSSTGSTSDPNYQLGPSNSSLAFLSQLDSRGGGGGISSKLMSHSPSRPSPLHTATFGSGAEDVPAPPAARSTLVPQALQQPILSPGTRALRSHAPGQSLPQGLAAGLSRLHLQQSQQSATSSSPAHPSAGASANGQTPSSKTAVRRGKDELDEEDLFEMDG